MQNNKKDLIICTTEYITSKEYGGLAIFLEKFLKILKRKYNVHLIISSSNSKTYIHNGVKIYNVNINKLYLKILRKYFASLFFIIQSFFINKKINELIKILPKTFLVHFSNYQYIGLLYKNKLPIVTRLSSLETLWDVPNSFSLNKTLEKITLSKSNIILSPSKFLITELKNKYGLKGYFLPPLIEKIKKRNIKIKKKIIIVTFGSISPGKGSLAIEQVIHKLLSIHKDIYYYWIGNVDYNYYSSNSFFQKKLKNKTKFSNRIKVINKLSRNKLFKFINKSEIVILPSLRDNSPNACLEALSMGKIILARKNSGYDDLIKNKFNGFLFNKKNNYEIPTLVKKILSLDKKSKDKIKKNINIYNNKFNSEKIILEYNKYIKKII